MQSTLKITDPSKYFPRTHRLYAAESYFFFVSLILCFETTAGVQGKNLEIALPLLEPNSPQLSPHTSVKNGFDAWKQRNSCSKCLTSEWSTVC